MENYQERQTSYEGFERLKSNVKFNFSMHYKIFMFLLILHCIIFLTGLYMTRHYNTYVTAKFCIASVVNFFYPPLSIPFINPDGGKVISNAGILSKDAWIQEVALEELKRLRNLIFCAALVYLLYPIILKLLRLKAAKDSGRKYVRGSKIIPVDEYEKTAEKESVAVDLPVGNILMPVDAEQKHCFVLGRPGVGKTVALSQVLERLKERQSKIIVYDQKGDFLTKFYNPETDLIFNPLDQRTLGWNLFNEIVTYMDIDAIATSLVPDSSKEGESFWRDGPRGVLIGLIRYLYQYNLKTNQDLWKMVTANVEDMRKCLKLFEGGEIGLRYIENTEAKTTQSILSVLMQYTRCFEYMTECDGDFNVTDWLHSNKGGTIFITNYSDIKDTLKPILSLFIDVLGRKLLSMPDSHDRRVFFLLDEFGTLQKLSTMLQLLTLSRSKGGSVFLGIQDYGQIDKIYGRDHRQSIVNSCGNSMTFSVKAGSAKEASFALGDIEFMETEETVNIGGDTKKRSLVQRKKREPIMLPSDLMNLPDLTAVVKFVNFHHVMAQWRYKPYENRYDSFVMRESLIIENKPPVEKEEVKEEAKASDQSNEIEGTFNINTVGEMAE